jgi:hypothetical protein
VTPEDLNLWDVSRSRNEQVDGIIGVHFIIHFDFIFQTARILFTVCPRAGQSAGNSLWLSISVGLYNGLSAASPKIKLL